MDVLTKLEIIRGKLKEGKDVFLEKNSFLSILQESKAISAWNKTGLMIILEKPDVRVFVTFETKSDAFVQVISVEMPKTWNAGALFNGKVDVV